MCLSILRGTPILLCVGAVFRQAAVLRLCVRRVVYARIPICAHYLPCSPPGFHPWFLCCPSLAVLRAACICASCCLGHHAAVQPSLCPLNHSSPTPAAGCPSSAPSRDSYSFWSVADESSGYMRFASVHVIHRPPFECVTSAHHTVPTSASWRAHLHGRACAHYLTWAACSHIRGPRRTSCCRSSRHFISYRPSPTGAPVRRPRRFVRRRCGGTRLLLESFH